MKDFINRTLIRKAWLDSARQTSIGILLFNFGPRTWDLPQTLGEVIDNNPIIKRRFKKWLKPKKNSSPFGSILIGEQLAYMLRPTPTMIKRKLKWK